MIFLRAFVRSHVDVNSSRSTDPHSRSNQLLIIHAWWMFVICFHFPFVCCSNCEIFSLLFGGFSYLFLFPFGKFRNTTRFAYISFTHLLALLLFFFLCCCCSSSPCALPCCSFYRALFVVLLVCSGVCVLFSTLYRWLSFSSLSLFMFIHCLQIMAINWYAKWELIMSSVRFCSVLFCWLLGMYVPVYVCVLIQSKPE